MIFRADLGVKCGLREDFTMNFIIDLFFRPNGADFGKIIRVEVRTSGRLLMKNTCLGHFLCLWCELQELFRLFLCVYAAIMTGKGQQLPEVRTFFSHFRRFGAKFENISPLTTGLLHLNGLLKTEKSDDNTPLLLQKIQHFWKKHNKTALY